MIVTIHQPQYLPWLGYFDKINRADIFVLLDNVQYKKNEWQNRNRIKTANGWQWVTVPVKYKFPEKIYEVKINNSIDWKRKHLNAIFFNYAKSQYFRMYQSFFQDVFSRDWETLLDINVHLIYFLMESLCIDTKFLMASDLRLREDPTDRLIDICKEVGADVYLAGKDGKNYMDIERFEEEHISITFQDFQHPTYNQLYMGFEYNMSIIDLLFNYGQDSMKVLGGEC
ncbi:MAG: WbqC family protein [Thermodesulfobacteriota bacterium]|nr:WbqC family protein [Thermodesulfobacteriota bacterium]